MDSQGLSKTTVEHECTLLYYTSWVLRGWTSRSRSEALSPCRILSNVRQSNVNQISWWWHHDTWSRKCNNRDCRAAKPVYIKNTTARSSYTYLDNKISPKQICNSEGIVSPQIYALIENHSMIRTFEQLVKVQSEFVIRPARRLGGRRIIFSEFCDWIRI